MPDQNTAVAVGAVFVGGLCVIGAINQVLKNETWGGTGRGKAYRDREPVYFWYMFAVRVLLGAEGMVGGRIALQQH